MQGLSKVLGRCGRMRDWCGSGGASCSVSFRLGLRSGVGERWKGRKGKRAVVLGKKGVKEGRELG